MAKAYLIASANGTLPANARQIMYAARPDILRLANVQEFGDNYFTQTLLPNYVDEHPDQTREWDVVYDARGKLIEPHTRRSVALGTIEVRQYLGQKPYLNSPLAFSPGGLFPTSGPLHRYAAVLFVEKEGFGPLLTRARIAERFDIAIMSTKGMSVVAARYLIDELPHIDKVLVLHDFDVSGFSIFGTLRADGRRFSFKNEVQIIDIGLRLSDIEEMGLESEPAATDAEASWSKRINTLRSTRRQLRGDLVPGAKAGRAKRDAVRCVYRLC